MMHLDGIDDGQNSNIHPPGPTASSRSIHIAGIISWCGSLTSGRDEWIQSFLSSHSDGKGSSTVGCYFSMWGSIVSASLQSLDQNPWGTLSYHLSHSGRTIHFRVTYTWVAQPGRFPELLSASVALCFSKVTCCTDTRFHKAPFFTWRYTVLGGE